MADQYWIGGTSGAFGTAANWLSAGVPADGDNLWYGEWSLQSCATGLTQAAKAFPLVIATKGFKFSIGSVGNELEPENGIGTLIWEATGAASEFHADTEIDYIHANSPALGVGMVLQCTKAGDETTELHQQDGLITLGANFNFVNASLVRVNGGRLIIASGCTMGTGNIIEQFGGEITSSQALITAKITGGTLNLDGTATATLIETNGPGARFNWKSTGTITGLRCNDGICDALTNDKARTLTQGWGRNPGRFLAGHGLVTTSDWITEGGWTPTYPHGVKIGRS